MYHRLLIPPRRLSIIISLLLRHYSSLYLFSPLLLLFTILIFYFAERFTQLTLNLQSREFRLNYPQHRKHRDIHIYIRELI